MSPNYYSILQYEGKCYVSRDSMMPLENWIVGYELPQGEYICGSLALWGDIKTIVFLTKTHIRIYYVYAEEISITDSEIRFEYELYERLGNYKTVYRLTSQDGKEDLLTFSGFRPRNFQRIATSLKTPIYEYTKNALLASEYEPTDIVKLTPIIYVNYTKQIIFIYPSEIIYPDYLYIAKDVIWQIDNTMYRIRSGSFDALIEILDAAFYKTISVKSAANV